MLTATDNVFGYSGYSKAVRELMYALSKRIDVSILPQQPTGYLPDKCWPLIKDTATKDSIIFGRPYFDSKVLKLPAKHRIGNIVLESTQLPERMVDEANQLDQVWVPSKWVFDHAAYSGIIEDKLRIIPHGYDPRLFKKKAQKEGYSEYYTFLFCGGYTGRGDRKGADLLAQAFKQEFAPREKVRLYFKINSTYGSVPKQDLEIDKRIIVDDRFVTDSQMPQIYQSANCFVNASYAEGFNMTCLEAAACGLPLISTLTGEDYVDDLWESGRIYVVSPEGLVPAKFSPWDIGKWLKPHQKSLQEGMRAWFDNKAPVQRHKGIEKWTWDQAAKKAVKCLEELNE